MDNERDRILHRLRKLMAMNGGNATEGEVENSIRLARRLMAEYNVSESEIHSADPSKIEIQDFVALRRITLDYWEKTVAVIPCEVCDVKAYTTTSFSDQTIHFVGLPRDVAMATELLKSLIVTISVMSKMKFGKSWTMKHRSYCMGFIDGCLKKLRDEKESEVAASKAIVLSKSTMINKWLASKIPDMTPLESPYKLDSAGYRSGFVDGHQADIGVTNRLRGA